MDRGLDGRKPEIDYPCSWSYQVIGLDEEHLRGAVAEVVISTRYTLTAGRVSSGGKYRSLAVEIRVESEEERLRIFESLSRHPAVRFVI